MWHDGETENIYSEYLDFTYALNRQAQSFQNYQMSDGVVWSE